MSSAAEPPYPPGGQAQPNALPPSALPAAPAADGATSQRSAIPQATQGAANEFGGQPGAYQGPGTVADPRDGSGWFSRQAPPSPSGYPAPPSGFSPAPGFGPQPGSAPQPGAVPQAGSGVPPVGPMPARPASPGGAVTRPGPVLSPGPVPRSGRGGYGGDEFGSPGSYPAAGGYRPQPGYAPQQQPGFAAPPGYPRGGYPPSPGPGAGPVAGSGPGSFAPGQPRHGSGQRSGRSRPVPGGFGGRPAGRRRANPPVRQLATRNKALVAGAGVLAVIAVGAVIAAPKLLGGGSSADPGCRAYSGTALTAYNKTIDDMNAQASKSVLSTDMSAATTDLASAIGQAKSASVKSALSGLLTELQAVGADVKTGTVPASTVTALNAASAKADSAC